MKVVILAGGFGTRLSEYTESIPKPLVDIGGLPMLWHVMSIYAKYGFNDFVVALGYKSQLIKDYFRNYHELNSDFSVSLNTGEIHIESARKLPWNISLVDTGLETMTGGRLKRLKKYLGSSPFFLTYGDGLCSVSIGRLLQFHKSHGCLATVTAVRPPARFGELRIANSVVESFEEKPQMGGGWISGGFFVFEPQVIDLIDDDSTMLEREPMRRLTETGNLRAYKHDGFWQCMDTKRDHTYLTQLAASHSTPWLGD